MAIKENVRRRREARINEILSDKKIHSDTLIEPNPDEHLAHADKRLDDPEYVWKQKQHQWHTSDYDQADHDSGWSKWFTYETLRTQCIAAFIVFMLIWGMFQLNGAWAQKGQLFIQKSLTDDFEFDAIASWYQRFFHGTPSFIPAFDKEIDAEKVTNFD